MEKIHEYLIRNYEATKKRGKITEETTDEQWRDALDDEITEMRDEYLGDPEWLTECIDCVSVLLNMAMHAYTEKEILKAFEYNAKKNELRADYGV